MEVKEKIIRIYPSTADRGVPIKFVLHWDTNTKQYVLCYRTLFFGRVHFTPEEVDDMARILKRENTK